MLAVGLGTGNANFLDTGLCLDGCRAVSKIQQKMNNTGLFSRTYMFSQWIF